MPKNAGEVLIYILGITIVIVLLKGKEAHYSLKKRITMLFNQATSKNS